MNRETAQQIDLAAAEWAAKADRGLSLDEEAALEDWLAGDVRRLGAYGRIRAISLQTERAAALGSTYDPSTFNDPENDSTNVRGWPSVSRRYLLAGGAAAAASVYGAINLRPLLKPGSRIETKKGEVRQIALNDGSVLTLNTSTAVSVRFSRRRRDIELFSGEVLIDVAHDPGRPLIVTAGATHTRAVGTSFSVRMKPESVKVLVREGVVEVGAAAGPVPSGALRVAADSILVIPTDDLGRDEPGATLALSRLTPSEVHKELAWLDGRLAFEGDTIADAIQEFARYSDTEIILDDPDLSHQEIAGLYQANDPVGFARAIGASFNAGVTVSAGKVRISGPISQN